MLCLAAAFCAGYLMQFHLSEASNFKDILPKIQTEKKETIDKMIRFQRAAQAPVLVASVVWIIAALAMALGGMRARPAHPYMRAWSFAALVLGVGSGMIVFHVSAEALSPHSYPRYNPDYMAIVAVSIVLLSAAALFYFFGKLDRIGRARYLIGMAVIIVTGYVTIPISRSMLSLWSSAALMTVLCVPLVVARLRDLGRPAWHYFLILVPLYGFPYLGICLIVKKGLPQGTIGGTATVGDAA
jgi:uncharacterized membrane protein YhaH (DUF805 family)